MYVDIRVCEEDFDLGAEWAAQRARAGGAAGAMAAFVGLVRDRHDGDGVRALTLEHYPGMTERSIADIVARCAERWPVQDVVIVHRVGTLPPEAQIVLVQVAGGHRPEVFAACEYLMDYLKTEAVFWKREEGSAGARWVASTADDHARRAGWVKSGGNGGESGGV